MPFCFVFFNAGWHKGQPYIKDPKVQNFLQWMTTQEEASYVDKVVIGGYYAFPPLPHTFEEYCKNMNGTPFPSVVS